MTCETAHLRARLTFRASFSQALRELSDPSFRIRPHWPLTNPASHKPFEKPLARVWFHEPWIKPLTVPVRHHALTREPFSSRAVNHPHAAYIWVVLAFSEKVSAFLKFFWFFCSSFCTALLRAFFFLIFHIFPENFWNCTIYIYVDIPAAIVV